MQASSLQSVGLEPAIFPVPGNEPSFLPAATPHARNGGTRVTAPSENTPPAPDVTRRGRRMARRHGQVGRPALPPDAARERRVNLRLNADEYARIASTASALGLTPAGFLRRAGLGIVLPPPPVVPEVNLE